MDGKTLLAQGGLITAIVFVFLYLSGISYYISLFHAYQLGVFFVVPWEPVIGEGISTSLLFLFGSALVALWGSHARRVFENKTGRKAKGVSLFAPFLFAFALGLAITQVGRLVGVPQLAVAPRLLWRLRLSSATAFPLVTLLGFLWHHGASRSERVRWLTKRSALLCLQVATVLILLVCAGSYSNLLGKSKVRQIDYSPRARLQFSEDSLQKTLGQSWFVPILEENDRVVFVKYPSAELGIESSGSLVFVKRAVITSIDFSQ
jgi:hypothetical protein